MSERDSGTPSPEESPVVHRPRPSVPVSPPSQVVPPDEEPARGDAGGREARGGPVGWVAVEARSTRVVRPTADGTGWEWIEVEE